MRQILVVLFTLAFAQASLAQPNPDTLWTRTYGGSYDECARSVQQTADGGYVFAGFTGSFGPAPANFYLMKTDSHGDTLWTRTYGGSDWCQAYSVQQTADSGYILGGITISDANYYDFYLVRMNSEGDTLWTRSYGGIQKEEAYSAQQTADLGYIIAGKTQFFGAGNDDFYLVKTNSRGDTLWTRTYGGAQWDIAYSVQQTMDGGYIVAGSTASFGAGGDFYLVKTNSQGDTLWTRTYGGRERDEARCVQQTMDGGFVVVGSTYSYGTGSGAFYVLRTNSLGDTLWTRTYGGDGVASAFSVQQIVTDGGYVVAGVTRPLSGGSCDFYTVRMNCFGDTLWTQTYGEGWNDCAYSIYQTDDGGYILAGHTCAFGTEEGDFYLVKTGPDVSAADPIQRSFPTDYALYASYPNPFNPATTIRYDVRKTGPVSLRVFDLLGREVATLFQGTIPAGSHTITWDAADLPSGIYFCRMEAAGFVQTRKMLLVK